MKFHSPKPCVLMDSLTSLKGSNAVLPAPPSGSARGDSFLNLVQRQGLFQHWNVLVLQLYTGIRTLFLPCSRCILFSVSCNKNKNPVINFLQISPSNIKLGYHPISFNACEHFRLCSHVSSLLLLTVIIA